MTLMTWQDGFEGGENLNTVYGAGNVFGGAGIAVGSGRGGGNALACSGSGIANIATGISHPTDPVVVGLARITAGAGTGNVFVGDHIGTLASWAVDSMGQIAVTIWIAGFPTYRSTAAPRLFGDWRYVEFYYLADPTSGRIVVATDGDVVLDVSGIATATAGRGPDLCTITGSGALIDDFYIGLANLAGITGSNPSYPYILGDYTITGLAPAAAGSIPTPGPVRVDQQFVMIAETAPKPTVRVDQQFIILAIKRRPGSKVRPQVFGVGRV
jgi:hypothetical protein